MLADLKMATAIVIDGAVAVVQLSGLLLLVYLGDLSLPAIFGVMAGACALASVGWVLARPSEIQFDRRRFLADWRGNWPFSKWSLKSYLVSNTMPQILPWILSIAVGTAATGVLGACATLVGISNVFVLGVANLLTPQAAQAFVSGGVNELRRVLVQAALFLGLILGTVCLVLVFSGERVAVFIYGDQFQGCGPILVVLALSASVNSVGMIVGNGLWAIDEPRLNFVADLWYVSATLIATLFLIVPLGVLGAALATLAGASAGTVVRAMIFTRALERCRIAGQSPSFSGGTRS
jgi:O-antigen/teichoic acid export membrane protein